MTEATGGRPAPERARLLVTGATGFVGRRLCRRLQEISAYEVSPVGGPCEAVGVLGLDLTDAADVAAVVQRVQPDLIVHLAAFSSVGAGAGRPLDVWRANFDGTRALASAAAALDHPVRLIFASTAEVYGTGFNEGERSEASPLAPASAYARSKAACEYMLRDMAGDQLDVTVLRLFNHTGPGQDQRFVVPSLAAQLAALGSGGKGVVNVGNLDARRDFTDVEDIIDAYLAVLAAPEPAFGFRVYNVGSGEQRSIREILDALIARHGGEVDIRQDPDRMRPSDVPDTPANFQVFRSRFGWTSRRPFDQTLADIYAFEARRAASGE